MSGGLVGRFVTWRRPYPGAPERPSGQVMAVAHDRWWQVLVLDDEGDWHSLSVEGDDVRVSA